MGIDKPKYLYKYMSFEQFIDMIENERLYLTNITLWEDCYEGINVIRTYQSVLQSMNVDIDNIKNKYLIELHRKCCYAQSWTYLQEESDAMWRIYSPQKTGVRIKVKRDEIYNNIVKFQEESSKTFSEHIEEWQHGKKINDFDGLYVNLHDDKVKYDDIETDNSIKPYIKRKAFSHEHEYRFTIEKSRLSSPEFCKKANDNNTTISKLDEYLDLKNVIYYNTPNEIIEEVLLDPRAPIYIEQMFIKYCENRDFFNKNITFKKSNLYSLQNN